MISIKNTLTLAANAALVAAAVAAMPTASLAAKDKPKDEVVHCYGVNTCKGSSDCATATNACKGQNTCKGQGFKALTKKECAAQGGSLTPPKE